MNNDKTTKEDKRQKVGIIFNFGVCRQIHWACIESDSESEGYLEDICTYKKKWQTNKQKPLKSNILGQSSVWIFFAF